MSINSGWIAGTICEPLHWRHIREFCAAAGPDSHFARGFDRYSDARLHFTPMIGYAARDAASGRLIGAGGVLWLNKHIAEGMFAIVPEFAADTRRSRWVHRPALEVLELAHRHTAVIRARPDAAIPAAERWMRRLGFEPPQDGTEYWTHGVGCSVHPGGGTVHCGSSDGVHGLRHLSAGPGAGGGG